MGGFWEQLQFAFYSKQFGRKERLQFYESMSTLLENGVPLKDAVAEVHKIFAHEGQHPFHPVAIASREALMGCPTASVWPPPWRSICPPRSER